MNRRNLLNLLFLACGLAGVPATPARSQVTPDAFAEAAGKAAADAAAAQTMAVKGADPAWLFLVPELQHVATGEFWTKPWAEVSASKTDPTAAIVDFKNRLKKLGVDLLLVPVPAKATIYPDKLVEGVKMEKPVPDVQPVPVAGAVPTHAGFYKGLKTKGVEVLDLEPLFRELRAGQKVYCEQDTHWSPAACEFVAARIAAIVKDKVGNSGAEKVELAVTEPATLTIAGDLTQMPPKISMPAETLDIRYVGTAASGGKSPVPPAGDSPVILLGDSHTLVFHEGGEMHCKGAGLADHLAHKTGMPVDVVANKASGGHGARLNLLNFRSRNASRYPDYWKNKKLLIWCFSVREFTRAQMWTDKMPVVVP